MKYGCHNRKAYKTKLFVQNGWWVDGQTRTAKVEQAEFRMAPDCQYTKTDLGQVDERCKGCKHKMDAR